MTTFEQITKQISLCDFPVGIILMGKQVERWLYADGGVPAMSSLNEAFPGCNVWVTDNCDPDQVILTKRGGTGFRIKDPFKD